MTPVDFEMAAQVHQNIKEKEVELYLEDGVTEFEDRGGKTLVKLESGKEIEAELVIMAIGVKPDRITSYNVCYTKLLRSVLGWKVL